ncbi:MAG: trypsin-like peptidase domain-containing protein, partial [Oligoflexales bacterium]|nr:trypsin-like peptidase domain-containing protein [Oligoflexales bacterium]
MFFEKARLYNIYRVTALLSAISGTQAFSQFIEAPSPQPPVQPSILLTLQERQKEAIAAIRFSVVNVKAYMGGATSAQNIGAGVIVSEQCHVVTNSHVIADFDTVEVSFWEGGWSNTFKASIIANDPAQDLALLQFAKGGPCVPAILPPHPEVEIGEMVFIIGSPFALKHTVTKGIVSKVKRDLSLEGMVYPDMIQTDAAI